MPALMSSDAYRKSFQSGKVFAQRQSFWDALFTVLSSRDSDWLGLLLKLIITTGAVSPQPAQPSSSRLRCCNTYC